jgi:hypothetical protein
VGYAAAAAPVGVPMVQQPLLSRQRPVAAAQWRPSSPKRMAAGLLLQQSGQLVLLVPSAGAAAAGCRRIISQGQQLTCVCM